MSEVTITEAEYHRLLKKAGEAFEPNPAKCRENGHVWKSLGGANAGCCRDCQCSIAVSHCIVCGDCDYGETPENAEIIRDCFHRKDMEAEAEEAERLEREDLSALADPAPPSQGKVGP